MTSILLTAKFHFHAHKHTPLDTILNQSDSRRQRRLFLSDNLSFILPATLRSLKWLSHTDSHQTFTVIPHTPSVRCIPQKCDLV